MASGDPGILTATAEHLLLQTERSVQRWDRTTVSDVRFDDRRVHFAAGGCAVVLDLLDGRPTDVLGPSQGRPTEVGRADHDRGPGRGAIEQPLPVMWAIVGSLGAATLGVLMLLSDDVEFGFALGLWLTVPAPVAVLAAHLVFGGAPDDPALAPFEPLRDVVAPTSKLVPLGCALGGLLLAATGGAGVPFLTWLPVAALVALLAWVVIRRSG